ncbi:MAG: hypothetical protein HC792_04550 [Acaryochloridaceae cyanobacterium CSU_5_19]|nr:hypothetical protein [Acaryochloridaceae cyanobacterium CSU_5_19]
MMVADIRKIQQEIDKINQDTTDIVLKAQDIYQRYLSLLGASVSRQLILSSYHLCTQTYPAAFLQLPLHQQQFLQQELQNHSQQLQTALEHILDQLDPLLPAQAIDSQTINSQTVDSQALEPQAILMVLQNIEQAIFVALRDQSAATNELLQKNNIIPTMAIDLLFEVAAKAAEHGRSITTTPHLITALMDDATEAQSDARHGPVVAIFLQLSDLEFMDTAVMQQRHQIRQLWQQLKALHEIFTQKQQEKIVAEATAAWRASWVVSQDF